MWHLRAGPWCSALCYLRRLATGASLYTAEIGGVASYDYIFMMENNIYAVS